MSKPFCFTIAGRDIYATYTTRVTLRRVAEQGPSYSSGGEPACPGEFEVEMDDLFIDDGDGTKVDCPEWLRDIIEQEMQDDQGVYETAMENDNA